MVELKEFIKRLPGLEQQANKMATELLMKRGDEIVKFSNALLMKGKNTLNETIQKGYSTGYAKRRRNKGLQTAYVDLYFTGKFQKTSKAVKSSEGMDIDSDADYEKYLRDRYPNIRGLTKEQAEKEAQILSEKLVIELKKYLVS